MDKNINQGSLFSSQAGKKPTQNPLYIVKDGHKVNLNTKQIFNADKYDNFIGVTFSASPQFINKYITDFKHIKLVIGTNGDKIKNRIYASFSGLNQNLFNSLKDDLKHHMTHLYQDLDDYAKKLLYEKNFLLSTPLTNIIHSKFYLMENSKSGENRIIVGSANLSERAFNPKEKQFEDILIFDNSKLFNNFKDYFENTLFPTTKPYFPSSLRSLTGKKLNHKAKHAKKPKNNKDKDKEKHQKTIVLNPDEIKKAEQSAYTDDAKDIQQKQTRELIVPSDLNEMKEIKSKAQSLAEQERQDADTSKTALELQTSYINPRTKKPRIKRTQSLNHTYRKHVHVEQVKDVNKDVAHRRAQIISYPTQRVLNRTGLFTEQSNHHLIPYGRTATKTEIIHDLKGIQDLKANYDNYAVDSSNEYFKRIYEAILYAFESPFLYEVRRKVSGTVEGQDIPQFLFIGGQGGTGKSKLLEIIIKMLGFYNTTKPTLYNAIIPSGVRQKKSLTIKQIKAWIFSENVAPIILDEIPSFFFKKINYGNNLVVDTTNLLDESSRPFPTFIGTTNSSNYTFPDRASRRTYYLGNDRVFNSTYRQESNVALKKVYHELDDNLFEDFVVRFSNLLYKEPDKFWTDSYGKNGQFDFLKGARYIFKEYYKIWGKKLPQYFPTERLDDTTESGAIKWKKLYEAHYKEFKTNLENKKTMIFDINSLNKYDSNRWGLKPSQVYKNCLDSRVVVGNKNSQEITLNKKRFFKWIGINPHGMIGLFFKKFV